MGVIVGDIKRLIIEIHGFPLGRRISGYIMLLIAFVLLVLSIVYCGLMTWGAIEGIFDGSFPPYIDPEETEWDIR